MVSQSAQSRSCKAPSPTEEIIPWKALVAPTLVTTLATEAVRLSKPTGSLPLGSRQLEMHCRQELARAQGTAHGFVLAFNLLAILICLVAQF